MDADQMACSKGAGLHCVALVTTYMTGTVGVGNCVPTDVPKEVPTDGRQKFLNCNAHGGPPSGMISRTSTAG